MKTRSNAYWDKRSLARMKRYHKGADETIEVVTAAYKKAQKDLETEVQKIFNTFATDGNLSPEKAKKLLNEPISKREWNSIKNKIGDIKDPKIKRRMLNRLNAPAYRARISRLEALEENVYIHTKIIADVEIRASRIGYISTLADANAYTMYDIQRGLGIGFNFNQMPTSKIEAILKDPWSGAAFSDRIWKNTDVLAEQVTNLITSGFMSGAGTRQMARELALRMGQGEFAANRLIRTETTYMANVAEMETNLELGIDEYMFMATLDKRTSRICGKLDLQVFKVKDAKVGKNMPPMHPFCRSATRAYFGPKTLDNIQRRARNPETGKNELVAANMSHTVWKEKYMKAG